MATVHTDATELRTIALYVEKRGRGSRLEHLRNVIESLDVDGMLVLDDEDLDSWDDNVRRIVASCADGVALTKDQRKSMRGLLSALIRETRKVHGEDADLRAHYVMNNDVPAYAVERVK